MAKTIEPRMDLIPYKALLHIGGVMGEGCPKHGEQAWRKHPAQHHINRAMAHICNHQTGDTTEDHLGHAACRLLMALEADLGKTAGDKKATGKAKSR